MAKKRRIPLQDAMFLWAESSETMMHVGALMPFTPPHDAPDSYLRDLFEEAQRAPVQPPFTYKLTHPGLLTHPRQAWIEDPKFDIDYHVRRSALASPGDERELGRLVSRLHSHQLDFTRPLWEMHLIEGLEGGRFALYVKLHHALVDGYSAVRLLSRSLTSDPDDERLTMFYSLEPSKRPAMSREANSLVRAVGGAVNGVTRGAVNAAGAAGEVAKAVARLELRRGEHGEAMTSPWQAPNTILNRRTSRTRRFATQQYDTERVRRIAKASGGTLNDVVMAICGGGLRRYLEELDALPDRSLIAFMPVSLRGEGDEGGGNNVGLLLASMGTDVEDPVQALSQVIRSTTAAKRQMKGMGQGPALAYSTYLLLPGAAQTLTALLGLRNPLTTAHNVVLSNVPGPSSVRYLRGSRMEAVFPVSIAVHGTALNITLETYADTMNFGFTGDRDALPSMQRLAVHTGQALEDLERALGLSATDRAPLPGTSQSAKRAGGNSRRTRQALAPRSPTAGAADATKAAKKSSAGASGKKSASAAKKSSSTKKTTTTRVSKKSPG